MTSLKERTKSYLQSKGWYVRKTAGLPVGVDMRADFLKFGLQPSCIFDIGAHEGETSLAYAQAFPSARVFAFEPVRKNFEKLVDACAPESRITAIHSAVGDRACSMRISLNADSQAHSLISNAASATEDVDVVTIDGTCDRFKVSPDFVKIDVEGFELQVLAGGARSLQNGSLRALLLEATLREDDLVHTQLSAIIKALAPYNYRVAGIYDQNSWDNPRLEYFNVLFVK